MWWLREGSGASVAVQVSMVALRPQTQVPVHSRVGVQGRRAHSHGPLAGDVILPPLVGGERDGHRLNRHPHLAVTKQDRHWVNKIGIGSTT